MKNRNTARTFIVLILGAIPLLGAACTPECKEVTDLDDGSPIYLAVGDSILRWSEPWEKCRSIPDNVSRKVGEFVENRAGVGAKLLHEDPGLPGPIPTAYNTYKVQHSQDDPLEFVIVDGGANDLQQGCPDLEGNACQDTAECQSIENRLVDEMRALIQTIANQNPGTKVVIQGYYTFIAGHTDDTWALCNGALADLNARYYLLASEDFGDGVVEFMDTAQAMYANCPGDDCRERFAADKIHPSAIATELLAQKLVDDHM